MLGQHGGQRIGLRDRARKPVEDEARARSRCACSRSSMAPSKMSSGTSSPRSMNRFACTPSGVLRFTAARSRSPDEMCGTPNRSCSSFACVPLPGTGGTHRESCAPVQLRSSAPPTQPPALHEALVAARQHVRFDLRHGVERHADDDQQRRAAEVERHVEALDQDRRQDADGRDVERAAQRDARQDAVDVLGGALARAGCRECSRRTSSCCRRRRSC